MKSLFTSLLLLSSLSAMGVDYSKSGDSHQIKEKTDSGHQVTVNYQIKNERSLSNKPTIIYSASPLEITVSSKELGPKDRVRIVLNNNFVDDDGIITNETPIEINPVWDGKQFISYTLTIPVFVRGYAFTSRYIQEISLIINGEWQTFKNDSNLLFSIKKKTRGQKWGWEQ